MNNFFGFLRHSCVFHGFRGFPLLNPCSRQHDWFKATFVPSFDFPTPVFACSACSNQQPVPHAHDPVILRPATMDAQWQQYYWNQYLMQQHHQQLTNPDTTLSPPPPTAHHAYRPTGTYGPLTQALRTHPPPHTTPTAPQAPTAHSLKHFVHIKSTTPTHM